MSALLYNELNLHRTDAVILAITDVKRAALDKDSMWPREFAWKRIAVWAVAALARTDYCRNRSSLQIDPSNDMVFRVGYVKCRLGGIRDALRSIKFRRYCRTSVAGVPDFTCSRD